MKLIRRGQDGDHDGYQLSARHIERLSKANAFTVLADPHTTDAERSYYATHGDATVRELAARTATENPTRALFVHDASEKVQLAAVRGVTDQRVAFAFTQSPYRSVAFAAVATITDESLLEKCANHEDEDLRLLALGKMHTDAGRLAFINDTAARIRQQVATELEVDEHRLLLRDDEHALVRQASVLAFHDPAYCMSFADDENIDVAIIVAKRACTDEDRLHFLQHPSPKVRIAALQGIHADEARLLFFETDAINVQVEVVRTLHNDTLRLDFVRGNDPRLVRAAIESALTDEVLLTVAQLPNRTVKELAILHFHDDDLRVPYIQSPVREFQIAALNGMQDDAHRMLFLEHESADEDLRRRVVSRLESDACLVQFATNPEVGVRLTAASRLHSDDARRHFMKDASRDVKKIIALTAETDELLSVFAAGLQGDYDLKLIAISRIRSDEALTCFMRDWNVNIRSAAFRNIISHEIKARYVGDASLTIAMEAREIFEGLPEYQRRAVDVGLA